VRIEFIAAPTTHRVAQRLAPGLCQTALSKTPEKVSSDQGVDKGKIGDKDDEGKWRNQYIQVNALIVGSSWIEGRNNPTAHQEMEIDGQKAPIAAAMATVIP
jgi:hypothetical protein